MKTESEELPKPSCTSRSGCVSEDVISVVRALGAGQLEVSICSDVYSIYATLTALLSLPQDMDIA
jgi:hypothetical protein